MVRVGFRIQHLQTSNAFQIQHWDPFGLWGHRQLVLGDKSHRFKVTGSIAATTPRPVDSITHTYPVVESQCVSIWTENTILSSFFFLPFGLKAPIHFLVVIVDEIRAEPLRTNSFDPFLKHGIDWVSHLLHDKQEKHKFVFSLLSVVNFLCKLFVDLLEFVMFSNL